MSYIFAIITTTCNACIAGDLSTAEQLLTRDIDGDLDSHTLYADHSIVMGRKPCWDHALQYIPASITRGISWY